MTLSLAVWLVILGALVLANLPFVLDRPLAPWPWVAQAGAPGGFVRWLFCLIWLVLLGLWSWGTLAVVGGSFAGGGGTSVEFLLKLLLSAAVAAALLYVPGWLRARAPAPVGGPVSAGAKHFVDRFLEVLVGYVLVGTLGFSLELNLGNAFAQQWEFYAITLSLFLVLGYPGFVWRYMMRRRR